MKAILMKALRGIINASYKMLQQHSLGGDSFLSLKK